MPDVAAAGRRMSHGEQLAGAARNHPDRVAFRFEDTARTYAETDERVTRLAGALVDRGVRRGDRVAVFMRNRLEVVESYLAACRLGAIAVPIKFRLVPEEVSYILDDSGARALIADHTLAGTAADALARGGQVSTVIVSGAADPGVDAEPEWGPPGRRWKAVRDNRLDRLEKRGAPCRPSHPCSSRAPSASRPSR